MNELIKINPVNVQVEVEDIAKDIQLYKDYDVAIASADDYIDKASVLSSIKKLNKSMNAKQDEILFPFKDAMTKIKTWIKPSLEITDSIEVRIKAEMRRWDDEQDRIKAEEERKFRLAEEDRIRKENEKLQKKIDKFEQQGRSEKAEEYKDLMDANVPLNMVVEKETPKVDTIRYSYRYNFEIIDVTLIPREYLKVDEVALRKVVTALKEQCKIPGVKVVKIKTVASK